MAKQIKLEFKSEGFRAILCGVGVQSAVSNAAEQISARASANIAGESEGFSAHVWQGNYGGGRVIGSVSTTDQESRRAEAEDKALSKAVAG